MTVGAGHEFLVIFDCDGVLVDSEVLSVAVDEQVLAELGVPMGRDEIIDTFLGRSHEHFVAVIESRLGHSLPLGWNEAYEQRHRQAYEADLGPVEGIVEALGQIKLPTCVASSGSHEKIRLTLGLTGLLSQFDGRIFSASDVQRGKPEPDLFLHAAATLGFPPARCLVVEDSPYGIDAALSAGMTALGYSGGVADARGLAKPGVTVFDDMRLLPGLVAAVTPPDR